ncbi:LIM and calponin homology domains-containing protein 1-like isoform X14 [Gasterosteus aculeatus]
MASPAAGPDVPKAPRRDESGTKHPAEPACLEAQKWIEAVTGKSFGDQDFRSGLENGILLCELLSAIKPGLVKKINRLPTPIAGLDNLSVFLRGCEELGLRGSQLFDPGDLQDTSIRANLKDSDCNRKIKNVLNTVFWLGKAASGCASFSGPTLNLKEFEGLLAQMKVECEEGGDSSLKRSVRDSGYDCWDSERSDSLSPPRHTRDNSLDSLDSFGSRSQHSPSPDVVNRGSADGRGSDSEADGSSRRPDVRKDDMLARRTASGDSRISVPFNQFLPNRTNASSYIPTARRRPHTEEGEQRRQVDGADLTRTTPPSSDLPFCTPETPSTLAEPDARLGQYELRRDEEDDEEEDKCPDPQKDDMMARRTGVFHKQSSATATYNRFLPLPSAKRCTPGEVATDAAPRNKRDVQADRSKKLNVRSFCHREERQPASVPMETRPLQPDTTVTRATSRGGLESEDEEDKHDENEPAPDLEKDDMMARRTGSFQKTSSNVPINRFLPVPGQVKYTIAPVSPMKPLHNRPKFTEKMASGSIVIVAAEPQAPPSGAPTLPKEEDATHEGGMTTPHCYVTDVTEPPSSPPLNPPSRPAPARICKVAAEPERPSVQERVEGRMKDVNGEPRRKAFWLDDDDLPPIMMSRRVAFMSEDTESVSMSDILNEEEVEHLPPLSQSRNERMHEPYNNFEEDDDHWQNDLARWKNRRRSASQELIKKEEERKRIEKRMKEEGGDGNKRKSIKTYKEIVEEKERREAELCDAYRNAASPEEAAMVLQRYALRFTISDATLDSLKLPRSKQDLHRADKEHGTSPTASETRRPPHTPEPPVTKPQRHRRPEASETNVRAKQEPSAPVSCVPPAAGGPLTDSESLPAQSLEPTEPGSKPPPPPTTPQTQPTAGDAQTGASGIAPAQLSGTQPGHGLPSPPSVASRPVPLLAAKPYCPPPAHKAVKMDGLVRVNGEVTEDLSVSTPPTSARQSPPEVKDNPSKTTEEDVSSEETVKDVPLEKTQKDVPLEKTLKDVPLEKTQADVPLEKTQADVPLEKTVKDAPLEKTQADVPLQKTVEDVTLEKTQADVPLDKTVKDVPLEKTQVGVPLEKTVKDAPLERTQKDVPLEKTVKDVPLEKTQVDVPLEKTVKDAPLEKTQKDVPLEKTKADVPLDKTVKDVPLEKTVKDVPLEKTVKDVPLEKTQADVPLEKTLENLSSEPLEQTEKDFPAKHSEKDVLSEHIPAYRETLEQTAPPQTERPTTSLGSAISSLIGGRNCTITTTIVTELTHVEPHQPDIQIDAQVISTSGLSESRVEEKKAPAASSPSSMQECSPTITATEGPEESSGTIETPMLNLAKRVNHWVWDPNEERKRLESWQQEQERLLQEQYQREQQKLKQEWEKAQVEVQEEERKHNEEERRILEETGTPLSPSGLLSQQTGTTAPPPGNNETEKCKVTPQQNGQRTSAGSEDQHASKLHFFQDCAFDGEPLKKQELWKTASLDRNPQLNPEHVAKRSESHDAVTNKQQPSPSSPQPPSPSRCVSGKRLCSGCSQQLEKGAAMIIDTLGLFFHIQCFKCGVCHGQLGDATAGTDVRIRNGLLSCHECYIASRGRGQPTTL